jgi:DNA polymerase
MICAPPGHRLIAADFSGIESRVTAWLSRQQSKIDQWAKFDRTQNPEDEPYFFIGRRFKLPTERAREDGKTADLAFGYMGSIGAWKKLAPTDDTTPEETIYRYRDSWRDAHPQTVRFWYALDRGAVTAIRNPNLFFACGRVTFVYDGTFLFMKLPSERRLAYPEPRLQKKKHVSKSGIKRTSEVVVFKVSREKKWRDYRLGHGAYGGTWMENAVSAVARDLLAAAMLRLETAGYKIVLHVHDEIVAEVPDGFGSEDEFRRLMIELPAWARGLPIAAKVRTGQRFSKADKPANETETTEDLSEAEQSIEDEEEPRAHQVDWAAAMEREFPRVNATSVAR